MFFKFGIVCLLIGGALCSPLPQHNERVAVEIQRKFEAGGYFEGDMRFANETENNERNGLVNTRYRWPNNIVYYEISSAFTAAQKNVIIGALNEIQGNTCIKFVQRTTQSNYVYVQREISGCWSYVGMITGKQELNLEVPGCLYHRTAMHEFMHALGFHHQHSAVDRDSYITVLLDNVSASYKYAFDKYGPDKITDFGESYDYLSVLHYNQYAFSKNGGKTIQTIDSSMQSVIGSKSVLSTKDIAKMRKMYNC